MEQTYHSDFGIPLDTMTKTEDLPTKGMLITGSQLQIGTSFPESTGPAHEILVYKLYA